MDLTEAKRLVGRLRHRWTGGPVAHSPDLAPGLEQVAMDARLVSQWVPGARVRQAHVFSDGSAAGVDEIGQSTEEEEHVFCLQHVPLWFIL